MEWLIVFAAGALAGSLAWPLARAAAQSPPAPVWVRQTLAAPRFRRTFGVAPSRDQDVQGVLQPVVEEHVHHLREQASRAANDLSRFRAAQPSSFIDVPRTVASLRKAKARKTEAERRLAVAMQTASLWGFVLSVPAEQSDAPQPKDAVAFQRAPSLPQTRKQTT